MADQTIQPPAGYQLDQSVTAPSGYTLDAKPDFTVTGTAAAPSVGGFLKNAMNSTGHLIGNLATAVRHPIDTLHGAADIVAGGLNSIGADPKDPDTGAALESDKKFDAFTGAMKQRYGSWDKLKHTLYTDPAGALADLSTVMDGVGGAAGRAADVADAAKLSNVADAARIVEAGAGTAAKATNPVGLALKPVAAGIDAVTNRASRARATLLPEEIAAPLQTQADQMAASAKQTGLDAKAEITAAKDRVQAVRDQEAARVSAAKAAGGSTVQANTATTTTAAQGLQTRFSGALDNTKFGAIDDLTNAATGGDEQAARVLDTLKTAKTPDQIQRASIGLQDYRTSQTASALYDKVGDLVARHDLPDVPLTNTDEVLGGLSDFLAKDLNPAANKNVARVISGIQEQTAGTGEALADLSYQNVRRLDSSLGQMIREGHTGDGALIGTNGVQYLQQVRNAVRADLSQFAADSGAQDVVEASKAADTYYQTVRAPFKQLDIARAGTATDADRIFDGFVQAGSGDKAQRYYNALDDKGRAAVRSQMATDAVNQATDNVRGTVDPQKLFDHLTKMEEPYGVFFQGKDKFELDGLRNIAKQMVLSNEDALRAPASGAPAIQAAKTSARGTFADSKARFNAAKDAAAQAADVAKSANDTVAATNARMNRFPLGSIAGAGLVGADSLSRLGMPGAALASAGVGGFAGLVKALTMTDAGRRFLLAGSSLQPGTRAMANLVKRFSEIAVPASRITAIGSNPSPQSAPPVPSATQ